MSVSESYKKGDCCGADCDRLDFHDDEPCWGQVIVVDEVEVGDDWYWQHACEGHQPPMVDGKPYKKERVDNE